MASKPLTRMELMRITRSLEEFDPERIGFDPEAMLLYAEDFATTTRKLLAEVERLRDARTPSSGPSPCVTHRPSRRLMPPVAGCTDPGAKDGA